MDDLDKRIVELICTSSQGSYRQLAKQIGVHPTTLIQRVKNLEAKGIINGYRAKIDYMKLGFEYMGIVHIYADNLIEVLGNLSKVPQVVGIFDVTGDSDAIAWVACIDREEFSETVKLINSQPGVKKTNTAVVLSIAKDPFDFIPEIVDE
ncbi:MAG: Lrp/AsnC family transcriptional regulator [Methanomassiliicoccaceae archaeon]|nr:Lrp/AsnC family transcriptional regulator [Methanomassiliicoccaceae archaeon]